MPKLVYRVIHLTMFACLLSSHAIAQQGISFATEDLGNPLDWPDPANFGVGDISTGDVSSNPTLPPGNDDIFSVFTFGDRAGQPPHTLAQTFQVSNTFTFDTIFIPYRNDITSLGVQVQIFDVADVGAANLPDDPLTAGSTFFLNETINAPSTGNAERVAQLTLDVPITLTATTGTAGYALRFRDDTTARFRWYRTSGSGFPNDDPNIFAGGQAFENGSQRDGGERDFGLVLTTAPPPTPLQDAFSVASGDFDVGATWSTGAATAPGFIYNIVGDDPAGGVSSGPHTVTVDTSAFNGAGLVVLSGATLDLDRNGVNFRSLDIQAGANLDTSSLTGTIEIGDVNASIFMNLNVDADVNFSPGSGGSVFLDAVITGTGDINIQSNNSLTALSASGDHQGTIRINGVGGQVEVGLLGAGSAPGAQGFNILELNSTGTNANTVTFVAQQQTSNGSIIFNQSGSIVHDSPANRRQSVDVLEANADVEVDLSTQPTGDSLRFRIDENLTGSGNLSIVGTTTAPPGFAVEPNEFEIGFAGAPAPGDVPVNDYSGVITTSNFVNVEVHNSLPNARFVIGANSSVDVGHREIVAMNQIAIGEVLVQNGGTFTVGFAETRTITPDPMTGQVEQDTRNIHTLRLTNDGTRDGSLTLLAGSTLEMQINGTDESQFDRIIADGDVTLAGQLDLYVNSISADNTPGENPVYTPTLGDTFELISIAPDSPPGDYSGNGIVDGADLTEFIDEFGATSSSADGNGDSSVTGADYTFFRDNLGAVGAPSTSMLTGTLALNVIDADGVLAAAGLEFALTTTSTALIVEVVAAPGSLATAQLVPEPAAIVTCLLGFGLAASSRRRNSRCS